MAGLKKSMVRTLADMENLRGRSARQVENAQKFAVQVQNPLQLLTSTRIPSLPFEVAQLAGWRAMVAQALILYIDKLSKQSL